MPIDASTTAARHAGAAPVAAERNVVITHPDKLLWPREGITKGDLISYYRDVAPVVIAHVRDRPLVMKPFPQGIEAKAYYRQTLPSTTPAWLPRYHHAAKSDRRVNEMPLVQDESALVWLANQAAIELHPWLSRVDRPEQPDFVVFDLDIVAPELFPQALEVALLVRHELGRRGLTAYPKTSGGDGVHLYLPVTRGPGFEETRAWAQALAERLARAHPRLISTDPRPAERARKVLVDYAQNSLGRTTVAVYSVRPRPGATVSTPLTWEEIEAGRVRPVDFTIRTVPNRLAERGDLFAPVLAGGQALA